MGRRVLRRWGTLLFVLLATAAASERAAAQTRADTAAILLETADELRSAGESGAARALLELIARRYGGTPAAGEVDARLALLRRMPDVEQSGRTELLVFATAYGAWLGVAIPLALESDSPEAYGLGLLLGAPAGFFAARTYADATNPTKGQARALTFGGMWGTAQAIGWAQVLDLGERTAEACPPDGGPCFDVTEGTETSTYISAAVLGGLAGIATGAVLARKPITAGTAAATTLAGLWGSWFGFGIAFLADASGDDLLAATLLGGDAALVVTGLLAPRWRMSESRARLISVGGVIGGLAGLGLVLVAQPDDEKVAVAIPLAASAAGLAVAAHRLRNADSPGGGGGGDGGGDTRGALINLDGGRWALDTPLPALRFERTSRGREPALYVPLLRARF